MRQIGSGIAAIMGSLFVLATAWHVLSVNVEREPAFAYLLAAFLVVLSVVAVIAVFDARHVPADRFATTDSGDECRCPACTADDGAGRPT